MRFSEIVRHHLGWCPNARSVGTIPAARTNAPVSIDLPSPDGGEGGPGRIDKGFRLAIGSIKILLRNLRLLWFSFLTGLVMIFSLATNLYIQVVSGANPLPGTGLIMNSPAVLVAKGSLLWLALTFVTTFISTFLNYFLIGGLIICVSFILSGKTISLKEGLARAWDRRVSLAGWAAVGAFVGTASAFIISNETGNILVTLLAMGAIFLFFVLTMFVLPAIVIDNRGLVPAIEDSVSLFGKMWGEVIVCFGFFFLILFVVYVIFLIPIILIGFSSGVTSSAGFAVILTILVLMVLMFIGSTILSIATLGLYTTGRSGALPQAFGDAKENFPV
ncbi:DUF6159 family protein [Methanoregula sp.]|uniref:DUF6159 family protein n=1 Tax=Methanoregula sp. TaxID=2052170 RepID=UPI00260E21F4|nr:DUF6159 family protein [Methanoregula sp.]MDD5143914.1 DUF6159 family protein [Methanoregula sp.]